MKSPVPLSTQPGVSINGFTLFMNGEAIGMLYADQGSAHARQDFKDLLSSLKRAGIETTDDAEEYRVRGFLEAEVEWLQDEIRDLENELIAARDQVDA